MPPHVLIVDVDSGVAQVTGAAVRHMLPGTTVVAETTPERGWINIRATSPDVMIIDPAPHDPAALFLIQLCQQLPTPPHIVILTSVSTTTLRTRAQRLGVEVYLEKPVELTTLIEQLRPLLERLPERGAEQQIPEHLVRQAQDQPLWYIN